MNQLFPQWKKILSHKYALISISLVFLLILYMTINLIGHTIQYLSAMPPSSELSNIGSRFNIGRYYQFGRPLLYTLFAPIHSVWWLYLCSFIIGGLLIWRQIYRMRIAYKDLNMGSDGTQRWTTVEELQAQYKMIPVDSEAEYEGRSGVPVATITIDKIRYFFIDTNNTNTDVLGSSQSGKTQLFTYPLIDIISRAEIKDSMIINDVKGDITLNTQELLKSRGYEVVVINTIDPANSARVNELHAIAKNYFASQKLDDTDLNKNRLLDRAVEGIKDFTTKTYADPDVKDKTWQEGAMSLVNAALYILCERAYDQENMKLVNVIALIDLISNFAEKNEDGVVAFDLYINSLPRTHMAKKLFETMKVSSADQRSSFMISVLPKLSIYMTRGVSEMVSENDFDFETLGYGEKPVALFILVPDVSEANYPIVSNIYSQIFQTLGYKSMFSSQTEMPRRVHLILEESMNILKLGGLSRGMNMNLERGLITHLIHQSNSQIDKVYGKDEALAIRGACGNHIFIMADNDEDAKAFSNDLGNRTIIKLDRTGSDLLSSDKSYREGENGRPLMYPDELKRLKPGEWVVDRTKKRTDLNGNPIDPTPIFANLKEKTAMIHAGSYLKIKAFKDKSLRGGLATTDFRTKDKKTGQLVHSEIFNEADYLINLDFLTPFQEILVVPSESGGKTEAEKAEEQAQKEAEKEIKAIARDESTKNKQFERNTNRMSDVNFERTTPISNFGEAWLKEMTDLCQGAGLSEVEIDGALESVTIGQLDDFIKNRTLPKNADAKALNLMLQDALLKSNT